MKLPHRTNHDDDDDGDDAKKQHSAPRSIVPLSMFECFKVRQNRLDLGNYRTRYADLCLKGSSISEGEKIQFQAKSTQKEPGSEAC